MIPVPCLSSATAHELAPSPVHRTDASARTQEVALLGSQPCLLRGNHLCVQPLALRRGSALFASAISIGGHTDDIFNPGPAPASVPSRLSESQRQKLAPLDTRPWHTSSESRLVGLLTRTTYSRRSHHGHCSSESLLANTPPKGQRDPILGV